MRLRLQGWGIHVSFQRVAAVRTRTGAIANDPGAANCSACDKNSFCKDIAPFIQSLILKTSPDRFDHWSGSACRLGFDSLEPT
jgi:hypothetical protein